MPPSDRVLAPLELAERFLQESQSQSRSEPTSPFLVGTSTSAQCGLGDGPNTQIAMSPRAKELLASFCPCPSADQVNKAWRAAQDWIRAADPLDRKRNHFLKAFRQAHGFDRNRYSPAEKAEYEAGLERVNREANDALRAASLALLQDLKLER